MLKMIILIVATILLIGCTYNVKVSDDGYSIRGLPAEIMAEFPGDHRIEFTVDDEARGKTTVSGLAIQNGSRGFEFQTSDRFEFLPTARQSWILIRSIEGTTEGTRWGGCVRDPSLTAYGGNQRICWCWSDRLTLPQSPLP